MKFSHTLGFTVGPIASGQLPPAQCNRQKAGRIWRQLVCVRLRAVLVHGGNNIYPSSFSWPNQIPRLGSLSLVDPNLLYCISFELQNLGFIVLSKQLVMWSRSSANGEPPSRTMRQSSGETTEGKKEEEPLRWSLAFRVTKTDPWK